MRWGKVEFLLVVVFVVSFGLSGCEKYSLDQQMEELCKKDGGVKVYETVILPPEMFDRWGDPFPGWRGRSRVERLGPEYKYEVITIYLKEGDPFKGEGRLSRTTYKIYRLLDNKLLGEDVLYIRSGGDFLVFNHPSSKSCPVGENDLIRSLFIKEGK